jgi:hypothetical protein
MERLRQNNNDAVTNKQLHPASELQYIHTYLSGFVKHCVVVERNIPVSFHAQVSEKQKVTD